MHAFDLFKQNIMPRRREKEINARRITTKTTETRISPPDGSTTNASIDLSTGVSDLRDTSVANDYRTVLLAIAMGSNMDCGDFLEFQDNLKKMRLLDDKIIYTLNTSIPTESFKGQVDATAKCKDLFSQIQTGHAQREVAIKKCINSARDRVKSLKDQRDSGKEDPDIVKLLRKEQNKLRLLQSELNVEEVVKQQTARVYTERCRSFYKPPSLD